MTGPRARAAGATRLLSSGRGYPRRTIGGPRKYYARCVTATVIVGRRLTVDRVQMRRRRLRDEPASGQDEDSSGNDHHADRQQAA